MPRLSRLLDSASNCILNRIDKDKTFTSIVQNLKFIAFIFGNIVNIWHLNYDITMQLISVDYHVYW